MSDISELLDQAVELELETKTENDPLRCVIDSVTRVINVPESLSLGGVANDTATERLKFVCPKIVGDNFDLSKNVLRVNYQNANNEKSMYLVDDVTVNGDNIEFTWLLDGGAVAYKGLTKFIVCAIQTDESGLIVKEWNTTLAEFKVLEGLEVTEQEVPEGDYSIIVQLVQMVTDKCNEATVQLQDIVDNAADEVKETLVDVEKDVEDLTETKADKTEVSELNETLDDCVKKFTNTKSGSSINLKDSADAPIQNMEVHGKNRFNYKKSSILLLCTFDSNGVLIANDGDTNTKLVYKIQQYSGNTVVKTDYLNIASTGIFKIPFTILNDTITKIRFANNGVTKEFSFVYNINFKAGTNLVFSGNCIDDTIGASKNSELQLELGTVATPYEPYTKDIDVTVSNADETLTQSATIDTETQTGWEDLKTYYPTTNIIPTQSSTIDVEYVADTKNYIDNKLIALTALALEG